MSEETVLLGRGGELVAAPYIDWERQVAAMPGQVAGLLGFMSPDHHRVRNFVVTALPEVGSPIAPARISQHLGIPPDRVVAILDELEKNLFFLYRDSVGSVAWAYPVTTEETGHRLKFSSGERLWAA